MPDSTLSIKLRYQGADVDGGTMPIEEVVISLQGFAGAYGKAANELIPSSAHELRVSAIDKGSFELAIIAWISSGNAKDTIETIKTFGSAAKYVFTTVRDVIDAKKHIKAKPYQVAVEGSNNTVVVINADGVGLPVALEVIELLKSKLLDNDLSKIASPLHAGKIENAQITADDEEGNLLQANISNSDKSFFTSGSEETSKDAEISGTIISLNKETLRGTFKRIDGLKVSYRYVGDSPESFYSNFSHKGILRLSCIAFFDENLVLQRLEIKGVVRLQETLALSIS